MSIKDDCEKIVADVDTVVADVHKDKELSDENAAAIIDTMQQIEDKLSNLLAEYGVEVGDERVD